MRDSGRTSGYCKNLDSLRSLLLRLCLFLSILCALCLIDNGKELIYAFCIDQVLGKILIHQENR